MEKSTFKFTLYLLPMLLPGLGYGWDMVSPYPYEGKPFSPPTAEVKPFFPSTGTPAESIPYVLPPTAEIKPFLRSTGGKPPESIEPVRPHVLPPTAEIKPFLPSTGTPPESIEPVRPHVVPPTAEVKPFLPSTETGTGKLPENIKPLRPGPPTAEIKPFVSRLLELTTFDDIKSAVESGYSITIVYDLQYCSPPIKNANETVRPGKVSISDDRLSFATDNLTVFHPQYEGYLVQEHMDVLLTNRNTLKISRTLLMPWTYTTLSTMKTECSLGKGVKFFTAPYWKWK